MKRSLFVGAIVLGSMCSSASAAVPVSTDARRVHEAALVLDTHLDTPANLARPGWDIADDHAHEGDLSQVEVSYAVEGRGGPAPVKISRERMPLSDFLNTFGLTIEDVKKQLK